MNLGNMVGEALASLQLNQDQEAPLQQIGSELDRAEAPVQSAKDDLLSSVADALDQGSVDQSAITPKIDALVNAQLREKPAIEHALVELHGVLDSQQRSQFVDALQAAIQGAMTPASSSQSGSQQNAGLGLTQDQIQQLQGLGALQGGGSAQGAGSAQAGGAAQGSMSQQPAIAQLLDAFRGDTFDPSTIAAQQGATTDAQQRGASILDVIDGLTRILTPDQRSSLASTLRAGIQCDMQQGAPEQSAPAGGAAPMGGVAPSGGESVGQTSMADSSDPPDPTDSVAQEQRGRGFGGGFGGVGRGFGGGFGGVGRGFGGGVGGVGRGFGPSAGFGGVGRGVGRGFGPGFGRGFGPGFGHGFGPGFGRGFGRGFGPGFGRGFGAGFGRGFGPGFGRGFGHTGFFPGFNRGFFRGFSGPFFWGFNRGFFVPAVPFVPTVVYAPFVPYAPFVTFSSTYYSSVDISIVLNAMFSTFAFF